MMGQENRKGLYRCLWQNFHPFSAADFPRATALPQAQSGELSHAQPDEPVHAQSDAPARHTQAPDRTRTWAPDREPTLDDE